MSFWTACVGSVGATFLAAWVGSMASIQAGSFYASLSRPTWAPPGGVFGPVWTVLYLMMAVSATLAWTKSDGKSFWLIGIYLLQLVLNALWSWAFFRWESGLGSMAIIVALWVAIVATIVTFWRVSSVSGALLIPYLLWVTFATALNATIWRLNPDAL